MFPEGFTASCQHVLTFCKHAVFHHCHVLQSKQRSLQKFEEPLPEQELRHLVKPASSHAFVFRQQRRETPSCRHTDLLLCEEAAHVLNHSSLTCFVSFDGWIRPLFCRFAGDKHQRSYTERRYVSQCERAVALHSASCRHAGSLGVLASWWQVRFMRC